MRIDYESRARLGLRKRVWGPAGLIRSGFPRGLVALAACALLQAGVWAQNQRTGGRSGAGGTLVDAPEINPKLVIGMVVLLVGGVLVLTARLRRRAKVN